jgi:hypothetical protein
VRLLVIVKKFVTMHGHMNVKLIEFCRRESLKIYNIIEDFNFHGNGVLDSKQPIFY